MIACINSVGAGEYSDASSEVCALSRQPVAASRTPALSKTQESKVQQRRVDPKIARARIAVRDGREKRQRLSFLIQAAAQRQAAASRYSKKSRSKGPKLQSVPEQAEYHHDLLPPASPQQSSTSTDEKSGMQFPNGVSENGTPHDSEV